MAQDRLGPARSSFYRPEKVNEMRSWNGFSERSWKSYYLMADQSGGVWGGWPLQSSIIDGDLESRRFISTQSNGFAIYGRLPQSHLEIESDITCCTPLTAVSCTTSRKTIERNNFPRNSTRAGAIVRKNIDKLTWIIVAFIFCANCRPPKTLAVVSN